MLLSIGQVCRHFWYLAMSGKQQAPSSVSSTINAVVTNTYFENQKNHYAKCTHIFILLFYPHIFTATDVEFGFALTASWQEKWAPTSILLGLLAFPACCQTQQRTHSYPLVRDIFLLRDGRKDPLLPLQVFKYVLESIIQEWPFWIVVNNTWFFLLEITLCLFRDNS